MTPCLAGAQLQPRPFVSAALVGADAKSSAFTSRASFGARLLLGFVSKPRGAFAWLGALGLGTSVPFGDGDCLIDITSVPSGCRPVQGSLYHASALIGAEASDGQFAADVLVGPSVLSASNRIVLGGESRSSVAAVHVHAGLRARLAGPLWVTIMADALSGSDIRVRSAGLGFRVEQRLTTGGAP